MVKKLNKKSVKLVSSVLVLAQLLCPAAASAFTVTPTETAMSAAEIVNPMRGWFNHGSSTDTHRVNDINTTDEYERFMWNQFENSYAANNKDSNPSNDYDFSTLETYLDNVAAAGRKTGLRFRTYSMYANNYINGVPNYLKSLMPGGFDYDYDKDGVKNRYHDMTVTSTFINNQLSGDNKATLRVEILDNLDLEFNTREAGSTKAPKLELVAGGSTYTIPAEADAMVRSNNTGDWTGTVMHLKTGAPGGAFNRVGYLRFDLSSVPSGVTTASSAKLKLFLNDIDSKTTVKVSGVTNDTWTETAGANQITWSWATSNTGSQIMTYPIGGGGTPDTYIPDWNDADFLSRMEALLEALGDAYNGDPRIAWIDIGMYGNFGEWHNNPIYYPTEAPSGTTEATLATKQRIIDAHIDNFPDTRLVMMSQDETALDYALDQSPAIGVRRDSLGSSSIWPLMDLGAIGHACRWMTAPIVAEPINNLDFGTMSTLSQSQVTDYHVAMVNNINFVDYNSGDATQKEQARMIGKLSGYRFSISSLTFPSTIASGAGFNVASTWKNAGITPLYEDFDVVYQLKSGSSVVWQGTSTLNLQTFSPYDADCNSSGSDTKTINDSFTLTGVTPGTYDAVVIVKDPSGYRAPLKLAINTTPNGDGSYPLGTVTVGAASFTDTLDTFEDGSASDWSTNGTGTISITASNADTRGDGSNYYGFVSFSGDSTWQYVVLNKGTATMGQEWDTGGGTKLRFWIKGNSNNSIASAASVKVQLRESDNGERWSYNIGTEADTSTWQQLTIPLSSFTKDGGTQTSGGVTNNLDKPLIDQIRFYSNSNPSTITFKVDRIEVIN